LKIENSIDMDIFKEDDITIFAKTNFRGEEKPFGIKLDDRRRHMYIIGKTGMGKSVMLKNLVIQDIIKGRGVAFIDPHGDSAEEILHFIPKNRINDVVYFNPADLENPVAFNILEAVDEDHKHLIASGMMGVFKKIWPDVWSPRMEYILSNTILALLDFPESTMLGINRMMGDQSFRRQVVEKIRDPIVRSFWIDEFGKWDQRFAREAVAAIQNKVGQFVSTPIVRHIVGQTTSTINMREIMDQGKILIVNLAKGRIGEEAMSLLGGMVVTRLYLAAMERVDIPENDRRDFFLYVDEFQNFATESFASILSEARKYRLSLIVAHQYITQLTEEVRDAVFGNVGTLVAFRVGASDAEFMEKEFEPMVMMNDLINLPKYQIYLKLMIDGVTGNAFSAKGLPPFTTPSASYSDKVTKVSQERYGRPRKEVEDKIHKWMGNDFRVDKPATPNMVKEVNYPPREPRERVRRPQREREDSQKQKPSESEKFMSPSQIVGFSDQGSEKVEQRIKQEIAKGGKDETQKPENSQLKQVSDPPADLAVASTIPNEEINQKEKRGGQSEARYSRISDATVDEPDSSGKVREPMTMTTVAVAPQNTSSDSDNKAQQNKKLPTVWQEAVCDRCGKGTKVPFMPEEGREIFCKECLREIRRQRAIALQNRKEKKFPPQPSFAHKNTRVSEEQKEKLKEDLREILAKIKIDNK